MTLSFTLTRSSRSRNTTTEEPYDSGPPKEQHTETARIEMHQSQLLKTNQSLLKRWRVTSRPHRLMKTSSTQSKRRDHKWPHRETNKNTLLLLYFTTMNNSNLFTIIIIVNAPLRVEHSLKYIQIKFKKAVQSTRNQTIQLAFSKTFRNPSTNFNRCQLIKTWMPNSKDVCCKLAWYWSHWHTWTGRRTYVRKYGRLMTSWL